jgi:hypothetical protein
LHVRTKGIWHPSTSRELSRQHKYSNWFRRLSSPALDFGVALAGALVPRFSKGNGHADRTVEKFYPAEVYHQDYGVYYPDDPYIMINDAPKVRNLRQEFPDIYTGK